jgi:molybdopterin-containing oxidoreductase family membrane subunit
MQITSSIREPLVTGGKTTSDVTKDVCRQVEGKPTKLWFIALAISVSVLLFGAYCLFMTWWEGLGVWGGDTVYVAVNGVWGRNPGV